MQKEQHEKWHEVINKLGLESVLCSYKVREADKTGANAGDTKK